MIQRIIPSSGETLPVIGLGTWQSFDVAGDKSYPQLTAVLKELHTHGGTLIDSSPMYGQSEKVIGDLTSNMSEREDFFYATKVWTTGRKEGTAQMETSMRRMQRERIDLMQIHNLTDWKTHLPVLREWKERGKIKYIGITHYTDDMHDELEQVFTKETIDFVQFNYSIDSRHAEKRLLKAAADHGVATLINRPFGVGKLFEKVKGKPVPGWAIEMGMHNWSDFFLKFLISHEAVTCVIPATSSPAHAADNVGAGKGQLPDEALRRKMVAYIEGL
jgi:diketogulonate reductase-like aldo/keto reductase